MSVEIEDTIEYLLSSKQPWVRYNTQSFLKNQSNSKLTEVKEETLNHPKIQELIKDSQTWPGYSLKRHNDAAHPIHKIAMLADFGLKAEDQGI